MRKHKEESTIKVWFVPPISDDKILPDTPAPDRPSRGVTVCACPGQYMPFSFCVRSPKALPGLMVRTYPIRGKRVIDGAEWRLNIRHVKCWWQSGDRNVYHGEPTFTPELLVKDPRFVEVDMTAKRNVVREPIQDAESLRPIVVPPQHTHQYWVTMRVPPEVKTGTYRLFLQLLTKDIIFHSLIIRIHVLPFELEPPRLDYSIYYNCRMVDSTESFTESFKKNRQQYRAEMINMAEHGVTMPNCTQQTDDLLEDVIAIRKEAGLTVDPLYCLDNKNNTGSSNDAIGLRDLKIRVLEKRVRLAHLGIHDVYFYGQDEATGNALTDQRAAWQAVREAGGMIHAAIQEDALESMRDLLDQPIAGYGRKHQIPTWHQLGKKIWLYGYPQTVEEYPETFRRNYGLKLLAEGWDGCCPYAYQHSAGKTIWDDFDHPRYRDHVFAYPTIDGVVDTIQWEGFREAVTDVRYATTLENMGGTVPSIEGRDLDAVRSEMIDEILRRY